MKTTIEPIKYKQKCYDGCESRILVTEDFVSRNNLKLMMPGQIAKRASTMNDDMLGFKIAVMNDYIPVQYGAAIFNPEFIKAVMAGKEKHEPIDDIYECAQDFLDYMVFAWMKAENERGISASRSIEKLGAWLRIMGREDLHDLIHDNGLYNPYGAPALIKVCKELGIDVPESLIEFSGEKV